MRLDAAAVYVAMGFDPLVDFQAVYTGGDSVEITWFSTKPQPKDEDVEAFDLVAVTKTALVREAIKAMVIEALTDAVMAGTDKPEDVLAAAVAKMKDAKIEAEAKP